jgi:NADH:ubiquinone oxidoreductase subunit F (NADH-binding)/NADH:ubiquinone oxidoreductase subunit E
LSGLVHELTLLQERDGWLGDEALRALAERLGLPLHRLESVSTFYTHFRRTPPKRHRIDVCRDLACALAGGESACAKLRAAVSGRDDVELSEISCLGRCDSAPAAAIGDTIVRTHDTDSVVSRLSDEPPPESRAAAADGPRQLWGKAEPYANRGEHYDTLRRALRGEPADLAAVLDDAGLRGMGGAGFPTGRKWSLVASEPALPRYVICNADESEPGTFKDREILHDLPHLVIEGMALASLAVGSEQGFVFIRHEYAPERRRLEAEIARAYDLGVLGDDVLGSGRRFDVEVFVSPGGYILGEETALIECMEDRRGEPRNKPPFPGTVGLHGQPTLMNNVETFAHATAILYHGAQWWRELGREGFSGHKFISVSGDVASPGVVLVPFGTTLGELLDLCGGMQDGGVLEAIAPGGASSNFLPADALDTPLDFQTLTDAGSMLGSGAVVFVAAGRNLVDVGLNVTRFFRNESCGKCVPCRVGSEKAVKLVELAGGVDADTRALLESLNETLGQTSICGLGQVALGPLLSILQNFPEDTKRG